MRLGAASVARAAATRLCCPGNPRPERRRRCIPPRLYRLRRYGEALLDTCPWQVSERKKDFGTYQRGKLLDRFFSFCTFSSRAVVVLFRRGGGFLAYRLNTAALLFVLFLAQTMSPRARAFSCVSTIRLPALHRIASFVHVIFQPRITVTA